MPKLRRLSAALGLASIVVASQLAGPALADSGQVAIIEDDAHLLTQPAQALALFRKLGATVVRVNVQWSSVAPRPAALRRPSFNDTDPGAYPGANWARYDNIVNAAKQEGISVDFIISVGVPRWAETQPLPSSGYNPLFSWWPSASLFNHFAQAVGKRYSGTYVPTRSKQPLPRVSFWTLWNEPNFGEDLGPQAINGSQTPVAPMMYRSLVDAGWSALQRTGHGKDTILIGETAARGSLAPPSRFAPQGLPGNFGLAKPLAWIRTLYCVDNNYGQLRGSSAAAVGCPTTAAGSRAFRNAHPGLFQATGWGDHPYPQNLPPTQDWSSDPDFAAFPDFPRLEAELDRLQRIYGSSKRYSIYNDEYGYQTDPPHTVPLPAGLGHYVSPTTAAYYMNWAEYLSWRSGRIASFMQYPVWDPPATPGQAYSGFSSGLFTPAGQLKPAYFAYRLPLYLPVTSTRHGRSLEVWGAARPANFAEMDTGTPQTVLIRFQPGSRGRFSTIKTVPISSAEGYFDVRVTFPSSGTVQLQWKYPAKDPMFPPDSQGATVSSRNVQITVH